MKNKKIIYVIIICILILISSLFITYENFESFEKKYKSKSVIVLDKKYNPTYIVYCLVYDSNMKTTVNYLKSNIYPNLIFRNWDINSYNSRNFLKNKSFFIIPQFLNNKLNKKNKFVANLFFEEILFIVRKNSSFYKWSDILKLKTKITIAYHEEHYGSYLIEDIYKNYNLSRIVNLKPVKLYQELGDMWEENTVECIFIYGSSPSPFVNNINEINQIRFLNIKNLYNNFLKPNYSQIKSFNRPSNKSTRTRSSSKFSSDVPFFETAYSEIELDTSYGFYVNMFANQDIDNCIIYNILHKWVTMLPIIKKKLFWTRLINVFHMSSVNNENYIHDGALQFYSDFFENKLNLAIE